MRPLARPALLGLALASACAGDLDPAWKIKTFRVFGARIEDLSGADPRVAEAAPGDRVRLTLSYVDPSTAERPITATWVFCAQSSRQGNSFGCAPGAATILQGVTVDYSVPTSDYSVDPFGRARVQGVAVVCAGGTVAFDPATMQPACTGAGAEGVTMTRSIIVNTTGRVDEQTNRNPELTDPVLYVGGDARALRAAEPARVPRCAGDPCPGYVIELRVGDGSRQVYRAINNQAVAVMQPERLQFGYFTTGGEMDTTFFVDTAERPAGPVRNTWKAPSAPGPVTFVFTAQDVRGGFEWIRRTVIVE